MAHSVFYGPHHPAIRFGGNPYHLTLANNIFTNMETAIRVGNHDVTLHNNLFYNVAAPVVIGGGGAFSQRGAIVGQDPRFVAPSTNFRLQTASSARKAGITLGGPYSVDRDGNARLSEAAALGAYEGEGGPPGPPPRPRHLRLLVLP